MRKEYQKFHGLEECYVVKVVEGNGTDESPAREVLYVFSSDLCELGKIDNYMDAELRKNYEDIISDNKI